LPLKWDKPSSTAVVEEIRGPEVARPTSTDDKLKALKQYRRARGLCDRCAEKWVFGHKCAPTIQLHAIQELWELLPGADDEAVHNAESLSEDGAASLCAVLSESAALGIESPKSMRLWGKMHDRDVLILVDSGSFHTFVSSEIAAKLQGVSPLSQPMQVKVASGCKIQCTQYFQNQVWSGYSVPV
jgi:hypothetical protein